MGLKAYKSALMDLILNNILFGWYERCDIGPFVQ